MYAKNTIARRRSSGWADRRRHYRRLFEHVRIKTIKEEETPKIVPVEKD